MNEAFGADRKSDSPYPWEVLIGAHKAAAALAATATMALVGKYFGKGLKDGMTDVNGTPIPIRAKGLYVGYNEGIDAFKHTLFAFLLARSIGPRGAKIWQDAHEISGGSKSGSVLMDLYNNNVGHRLAMDPRNSHRNPVAVVLEALEQGKLQTEPFKITPATAGAK